MCLQKEREQEVARLLEERHQARELKRKEEYVKQCRLDLEKRRLEVKPPPPLSLTSTPRLAVLPAETQDRCHRATWLAA